MARRKEDPKKIRAQQERDRAQTWLEVLCKGIGHALADENCRRYPDEIRLLVTRINGELTEAIENAERANKAYEPYWKRRFPRSVRRAAKAKAK
jgi:hypothetical protein